MGGNAMTFETVRLNKEQYNAVRDDVVSTIRHRFVGLMQDATDEGKDFLHCEYPKIHDIVAYRNKGSFGDLDVLIYDAGLIKNRTAFVQDLFSPTEIYHNSNCFSFDYAVEGIGKFQVDLIFVAPGEFETSMRYFSFNDLSNLIGRIFHKFGTKYGHDGLTWVIRDENHVIGEIQLSKDINEICKFGGYDPVRYKKGFDDLIDIFEFVVSSQFYDYSIFALENRNYTARVRDAKRKTYTSFLKWAEEQDIKGFDWNKDKTVYQDRIFQFFPHARQQYADILADNEKRKLIKSKFNGELVMSITKRTGKELGFFMKSFREKFDDQWIIDASAGEIELGIIIMDVRKGF